MTAALPWWSDPAHLPFDDGPFRLRMGLRAVEGDQWLVHAAGDPVELEAKAEVLARHHERAVAVLPGTEAAAAEVLDAVVEHLHRHGRPATPRPDLHAIDAAGRLVAEDLCLHTRVGSELVLSAASVCFPQRWRLADKLGRSVRAIHDPIPHYHVQLGDPVDRVVARVGERGVWRLNWNVLDDDALFQPERPPDPDPPITVATAGARLWLRVERETLRRFSGHDSVLFTIRTSQVPLAHLAPHPALCATLGAALRALPADTVASKGLGRVLGVALAWLDAAARSATSTATARA